MFLQQYILPNIFCGIDLIGKIPTLFGRRRNRVLSKIATACAVITFAAMWWGALVNRFRIDVKQVEIARQDVPADFDGYRIVQISDLHTGHTDLTPHSYLVLSMRSMLRILMS